jgi:hypothetical protein
MEDPLGPGCQAGVEDVERPTMVDLIKGPAIPDPEVWVGREMVDPSPADHRSLDGRPLPDIGVNDLDLTGEMPHLRPWTLHHSDEAPVGHESIHKMTADKPRAAGHDRQVVHKRLHS